MVLACQSSRSCRMAVFDCMCVLVGVSSCSLSLCYIVWLSPVMFVSSLSLSCLCGLSLAIVFVWSLSRCHVCVVSLSLSCLCGLSLAVTTSKRETGKPHHTETTPHRHHRTEERERQANTTLTQSQTPPHRRERQASQHNTDTTTPTPPHRLERQASQHNTDTTTLTPPHRLEREASQHNTDTTTPTPPHRLEREASQHNTDTTTPTRERGKPTKH
jgi:hypothetical protein